jgi:NTE family protein
MSCCLAVDLLPLRGPRPTTLGGTAERMQDLIFANQSNRAIEGWQRYYDLRTITSDDHRAETARSSVTLVHMAYARQEPEVSGKMFDYSQASATYRWEQGHRVMQDALDRILACDIAIGGPGLSVHRLPTQEPS